MPTPAISFYGAEQPTPEIFSRQDDLLQPEASYLVSAATRDAGEKKKIELTKDKLVELVFDDNTTWLCHADTLEDVFPEAANPSRSADGAFALPAVLHSTADERGIVSDIALKAIHLFSKKAVQKGVRDLAKELEKKQLENFSGLYRLDADFTFQSPDFTAPGKPYLLFVHGTASSTNGSFSKMQPTDSWKELCNQYGNNILAFQHETLTKSPLQNVVDLVQLLPQTATLHLVTHSRGGLVGEILARYCNSNAVLRGFDEKEVAYLETEGRKDDLAQIAQLDALFAEKNITLSRFVRVACPANGTTLASDRLENFFNITANLVGFGTGVAANPVYGAFRNLIAAVIDSKDSTEALPGLEAMNPGSPFINVLNTPASTIEIEDPLVIIAGNCKVGINLKGLLVIASKLFYFADNDLVVNTRSMYGGTKRHSKLKFLFDEGGTVDHFHYFQNERTRKALLAALNEDGDLTAVGFRTEEQALLVQRERNLQMLGLEGGDLMKTAVSGNRPIVVLLPGIMGSNLSQRTDKVWIDYKDFLLGGLGKLAISNRNIEATSIVKTSYGRLAAFLGSTYDVVTFAYDWRKPMTESAKSFNDLVTDLLEKNQPIKIIGHSMGGVLVRDFILQHDDTWQALKATKDFRLLFLGSPLGGSFRIPSVLFGRDAIIDKLSKIDLFHSKKELLQIFSQFPGLLSLLPLSDNLDEDFAKGLTWARMAQATNDPEWPLPVQKGQDLDWFREYRDNILKKAKEIDYSNTVYIAGKDKATPCGYRIDETARGRQLVFLSTGEGDQSVTWETGIPKKMQEEDTVYYVNVTHGALANAPEIFDGIAEILAAGSTRLLSKAKPVVRGEEKVFRSPELRDFDLSEDGVEKTLLGLEAQESGRKVERPIRVSVCNGDLRYATYPVLAGHFQRDGILYAEATIDKMLNGALTERHRLGLYPGSIGSSKIHLDADTRGAVIVGLGDFGNLTASLLAQTVEQGISNYLIDVNKKLASDRETIRQAVEKGIAGYSDGKEKERGGSLETFRKSFLKDIAAAEQKPLGISALVIASGYGGLSIDNSVTAIIQGVQNANARIEQLHEGRYRVVEQIEFIELYEDRALSCFYSLNKLAKAPAGGPKVHIDRKGIKRLFGANRRIPAEYSESWWYRLTVQADEKTLVSKSRHRLLFTASTLGARAEGEDLYINPAGLESLLKESAGENRWSPRLGKTLFEMLLPVAFKEQLKKRSNINWILDKYAASLPWELLQDSATDARPLCVNAGMIRQLVTKDYRQHINAVAANNALVVAEPALNGFLPALPGAYREGMEVINKLEKNGLNVQALLQQSAAEILPALHADEYKIIHLAGHGHFDKDNPEASGMVIGENSFLTTADIRNMSAVPELVFVNCCHLGRTDPAAEDFFRNAYRLAANIGTQLIENGVKAVVVAGWAVNDAAALKFAEVFYHHMFEGDCFGDAVHKARSAIYDEFHQTSNTWGAYQCYGDPFYRFHNVMGGKEDKPKEYVIAEEAEIDLGNLQNEVKTGKYEHTVIIKKLKAISVAVEKGRIRNGVITEKEAHLYAALSEYDKAVEKFEKLLTMEKADFSVSSLEKYSNVRMKKYVADYLAAKQGKNSPAASGLAGWQQKAEKVIAGLESLLQISPTAERYNLLGSAYKRLGLLCEGKAEKRKAYKKAAAHYHKAHELEGRQYKAYALSNWYELESILAIGSKGRNGSPAAGLPQKSEMVKKLDKLIDAAQKPLDHIDDYWALMEAPNCRLCLQVVNKAATKAGWERLLEAYRDVWSRAGSKGDKQAEIEHLQLLADALSLSKGNGLQEHVEALREELEKLLV